MLQSFKREAQKKCNVIYRDRLNFLSGQEEGAFQGRKKKNAYYLSVIFISERLSPPYGCHSEWVWSFIEIFTKGKTHQQQLLMFPYENMQSSNSDCNWKIKEMEDGHWLWLILVGPSDFNERWRKGDVEVFFTGSACLFKRELGLRSLNDGLLIHCKGVMHTLPDCVAGTV